MGLSLLLFCVLLAPVELWAQSSTITASFGGRRAQHPGRVDRNALHLVRYEKFSEKTARDASSYRLPNDTIPESYVVELSTKVHEEDFSYTGTVAMRIRVQRPTSSIVLHSMRSKLTMVEVRNSNQLQLPIVSIEEDAERETVTFTTGSALQLGVYQLTIQFENTVRDDLGGFYRTSYTADDGQLRYAAVTQFQPVDARTAFPCYDEPGIRATFTIIITSGLATKVYSNMPLQSTTIVGNGLKQTRFRPTPRMPTYLVAFAITTDFVSARLSLKAPPSTISMELIAPPTVTSNAQSYGLNLGATVIRTVEEHFDQPYELPKLDQLAIPDFYFAAMENWGLVIYDQLYLLYDESTGTNRDKENVIATVVHEFVHQFLGNLLTPHWWSDLSLSEGFATFYEYYLSSTIEPTIRFSEKFTTEALQVALLLDCDLTVRPISYEVERRGDIERMFDFISYQKGGSVFRMFHHALGERTFLKGVRRYISTNKDRAVTPDDLFESLQIAVREDAILPLSFDVATIMKPWIYQSGYPLVTVSYQQGELIFHQEHFLYPESTISSNRTWWIPIAYNIQSENALETKQFWIPQGTSQVSLAEDSLLDGFVLVNPHQTGYYRVNYDEDLWERIISRLHTNPTIIAPVSRGQLIDDCFKLYYSDRVRSNVLYSLLHYVDEEVDAIPWTVAFANDNLGVLRSALIVDMSAFDAFSRFIAPLMSTVFNAVGFDESPNDPHELQDLRSAVIEWSCRSGRSDCRTEALARMVNDFTGSGPLPAYLKESVYCGGATIAERSLLDELWTRLQTLTDLGERNRMIQALACSENDEFLDAFLDSILANPSTGEWQTILSAVYQKSATGYEAYRRWLTRNALQIVTSIAQDPAFLYIVSDIEKRQADRERYDELVQLFKNTPLH
uniref:Aminopeptidase n=1 Tax=Anopheles farauti TaxID=69004 RepID=A0A182QF04_9DIPT